MTIRVTLVPHTHWDREWYEPFDVFVERLVSMMDTLLDLAAAGFPHFHLDGQTAMIDDYLARRPERSNELARRVREGRLSAGPWVTQMDEFLVSGESHVRNLRMGLERARALGDDPMCGYLPDQFGHIGQMPRILRDQGLGWAMVWRGVPERIERSTFRWRSTDGSAEVLCEYMPFGYFSGGSLMQAQGPAELSRAILDHVDRMRPYMVDDRLVIMVGYDHAGPDATLPERLGAADLPGIEAKVGSIRDHLEGRQLLDLPVWQGELRSSARAHLLPNVVSSRVHQKLERGRVETLLERHAEPAAEHVPGAADELRRAWTLMLWNGAHDSACGCSHDRVAADVDARFVEARAIAEGIVRRAEPGHAPPARPWEFERFSVPAVDWTDREGAPVELRAVPGGFEAAGVPLRFLDEPDIGDLYNFCPADKGQIPTGSGRVDIDGERFDVAWEGLSVSGRAWRQGDVVRLHATIHNERADHRLRLHAGLPHPTDLVIAGAPFELVERPLVGEGGEGEVPSSTWPARQVVIASDVTVLHEGVFEYEIYGGHEIAVTLLRAVGCISRESLATRPWPAGPGTPTPDAQMLGETELSLAIRPAS
jgi:alpha-mannosidase